MLVGPRLYIYRDGSDDFDGLLVGPYIQNNQFAVIFSTFQSFLMYNSFDYPLDK